MNVDVNLWGVLLAGVSSMVVGSVYYADGAFGKQWKSLTKVDTKEFNKAMPRLMPMIFLAALVTAYVVAYMTFLYHGFFQTSWLTAGVETSLILWLGISATTVYIHTAMDLKPKQLTVIALGNRLLSILAMGLIIGWIHP